MAKWDNMLAVIWLLRAGKRMTARQIAEKLEISERTVYRYIDALCMSGVPVIAESGHEGGFYLPRFFSDAPLFFSLEELKALVQASLFAEGAKYPFTHELSRALEKIQFQLNEEQLAYIDQHTQGFDVIERNRSHDAHDMLQRLERSVAACRTILTDYVDENGNVTRQRKVDPYGLFYRHELWYIAGFCHLRQDMRTFRVDRIKALSVTDVSFARPAGFSLREFLQNDSGIKEPTDGSAMLVKIEGERKSLLSLERHWYLQHCILHKTEKHIEFLINEQDAMEHMPMLTISYGTKIRLLEPAALKEKIIDKIEALKEHYK